MTTTGDDSAALQSARRLELDAAFGLGASFLCCVLGLAICWRTYRRADELMESPSTVGRPPAVQSHLVTARVLSLAGIVVSIALPLASIIWSVIAYSLGR